MSWSRTRCPTPIPLSEGLSDRIALNIVQSHRRQLPLRLGLVEWFQFQLIAHTPVTVAFRLPIETNLTTQAEK